MITTGPSTCIVTGPSQPNLNRDWNLSVLADGALVLSPKYLDGNYTRSGFGRDGDEFTLDVGDGMGPRSVWAACVDPLRLGWNVYWGPMSVGKECSRIALKVVVR